jgi:hypothetical protein
MGRIGLKVMEERTWSQDESTLFMNPLFDNFAHFAPYSTDSTIVSIAKVRHEGELIGVAPLTRLLKYRGTRLLEQRSRRWLDPLMGPFSYNNMCMIDASFMGFRHADPFIVRDSANALSVRESVFAYLKACPDVGSVMISEPAGDPAWLHEAGFCTFLQLPLVRIDIEGCHTFDDYLARIGRKRRHHLRQDRKLFVESGAKVEVLAPPIEEGLARELHSYLLASSSRNDNGLEVPFKDVMNSEQAFLTQHQWVIIARLGDVIAGFFSFIPHEGVIAQCHGGFNYEHSLSIKAYPNLIHAAVEYAIESGYREVTLGPLNNEAKRRVGALKPVMSGIWCRDTVSRFLMNKVFVKRLQLYQGEVASCPW